MTHFTFASIPVHNFPGGRGRVLEILAAHPECKTVSEVSDAREAVQEATDLQPYLVVLDIALPFLDGIETARMIRQKSPNPIGYTRDGSFVVRQRGHLRIQSRPGGGHA